MPVPQEFQLTFLDMGRTKYGDCLLLQAGEFSVLIDGGHSGDTVSRAGFESIPTQLERLLGAPAPWNVSLLVVTHTHDDHIGCLPKLVAQGVLTADRALVADEGLGWGHPDDLAHDALSTISPSARRLIAALREEPRTDLTTDREIAEYLEDAGEQEGGYAAMLKTLHDQGTTVVRYGRDDTAALVAAMAPLGMKILGPTAVHLVTCAASIQQDSIAILKQLGDRASDDTDDEDQEIDLYRQLTSSADAVADAGRLGAAVNDQSIVLLFKIAGRKLLLTGDMQFFEPGVSGLDAEMTALRAAVAAEAPFDFYKIGHHGSHNAFGEAILAELGDTVNFGITGGSNDSGHPAAAVLTLLKQHQDDILWLRTDKNGQFRIHGNADGLTEEHDKGTVNNTRKNIEDSLPAALPTPAPFVPPIPIVPPPSVTPPQPSGLSVDFVEVHTKVPHVSTKVTITIQVDPSSSASGDGETRTPETPLANLRIAPGRTLPNLLVVTDRGRLAANVGAALANQVIRSFQALGKTVIESLPSTDAQACITLVRGTLQQPGARYAGVLLLGGYDVVPSQIFDSLSPTLRQSAHAFGDDDQFIIWSDWGYGCIDGDDDPEIPVSRILDGHSAQTLSGALGATLPAPRERFGLRNIKRPYADEVFQHVTGSRGMLTSRPSRSDGLNPAHVTGSQHMYFMLHGNHADTAHFSGEDDGSYPVAFSLANVPASLTGVVFTGCCWGAVGVSQRALDVLQGAALRPVTAANSLATRMLQAGVCGYIGCTGTHYSPTGKPMHDEFWKAINSGLAPAPALFKARQEFLRSFRDTSLGDLPLKMKIYHQYTCLGIGW